MSSELLKQTITFELNQASGGAMEEMLRSLLRAASGMNTGAVAEDQAVAAGPLSIAGGAA